jgi:acyl carrier protein
LDLKEITSVIINALNVVLVGKELDTVSEEDNKQLFGEGSEIDSLDLVSIIVQIEEAICEKEDRSITILDESSVISDDSPFRTVSTLANLVKEKLDAE